MFNRFSLLLLAVICQTALSAQITITIDDLANEDDVVYVSTANPIGEFELTVSGPDAVWNYDWLEPLAQDSSVWVDPTSTNVAYFFLWFDANVAEETGQVIESDFFSLEDLYNFYDRSESSLSITGIAGTITGIPLPASFDEPDVIYELPLEYGNTYSSLSNFSFIIPGIGSWSESRDRSCEVDGWGELTTPYGTFNTLRVKCDVYTEDVIEYTGIEFPISYTTTEYRWMAPGQLIPVLQINSQEILGFETITAVTYRDTLIADPLAVHNEQAVVGMQIQPTVVSTQVVQLYINALESGTLQLDVIDASGQELISSRKMSVITGQQTIDLALNDLPNGMYFLNTRWNNQPAGVHRFLIAK